MPPDRPLLFRLFDPAAEFAIAWGRLPHWSQSGAVVFVAWRTADSLPADVLAELSTERDRWLVARDLDPAANWQAQLASQPTLAREFRRDRLVRWNAAIDHGYGSCPLRRPEAAAVVADSLRRFDGERYRLADFVVMPNHVHLLAAFPNADGMRAQCESWKHFTAGRLNALLGRRGRFWQADSFDHLVRTDTQFEYLRDYIADNPRKAGLRSDEFVHDSSDIPGSPARQALPVPHAERAAYYQGASP